MVDDDETKMSKNLQQNSVLFWTYKKSGNTEHYVYVNTNQGKRNLTLNLNDQPLESHLKHLQNQKQLRVSE